MTDLDVVISKLESIQNTMDDHSATLKDLSKAFSRMAVQQEQITGLQTQCNSLWRKFDGITSSDGVVGKIQKHQAQCPKEEMHRTFKWVWGVICFQLVVIGWIVVQGLGG